MAVCGSLQHIFESPLPESPTTLLDSLSSPWKAIKNMKSMENPSSFTEIFGELHFKDSNSSPSSVSLPESSFSSPISTQSLPAEFFSPHDRSQSTASSNFPSSSSQRKKHYKQSGSFSSVNSESLSLCTEGLGFESSDDVEDLGNEAGFDIQSQIHHHHPEEKACFSRAQSQPEGVIWKESNLSKRSRTYKGSFPPPISCIGSTGKPWVCFKSFREDGRFILQEIRFPTQEFLHACREGGRLRLQYIQSDDEILEGDEEEEEYEDEDEEEENESDDVFEDTEEVNQEHNNGGGGGDDGDCCDKTVEMGERINVQDSSE